jgi:hypothetical protein
LNIESLEWHDGNFSKIEFLLDDHGQSVIVIYADLYLDSVRDKYRGGYRITCKGVGSFLCSADIAEIKDNSKAGSIHLGYLNNDKLIIHLFGGLIEICAKSFEVRSC